MAAPKQEKPSLVAGFRQFVERRLGIVIIVGIVISALATFTSNLDKLVEFARKNLRSSKGTPAAGTSGISSPTEHGRSLQLGGGNFAGMEWRYIQERGLVQFLDEKIKLSTHRAEALAWIDRPELRNFRFSCVMELVSGDTSLGFGPVFWLQDARNFFHFAVRTAGHYRLVRYRDGKPEELVPWTPSPKVRPVQTEQTLAVVAKEDRIDLYVDGSQLRSYQVAAERSQAGRVGVYAAFGGLTVDVTQLRLEP